MSLLVTSATCAQAHACTPTNCHLPRARVQRLSHVSVSTPTRSKRGCSVSASALRSSWSSSTVFTKRMRACAHANLLDSLCRLPRTARDSHLVVAWTRHAHTENISADSISVSTSKLQSLGPTLQTGTVQLTGGSVRQMGHVSASTFDVLCSHHAAIYITSCQTKLKLKQSLNSKLPAPDPCKMLHLENL